MAQTFIRTYKDGVLVATEAVEVPAEETNAETLRARSQAALNANAAYLALPTPSNAQVAAQVTTLTKECNALIRLLLNQTDSTSGT